MKVIITGIFLLFVVGCSSEPSTTESDLSGGLKPDFPTLDLSKIQGEDYYLKDIKTAEKFNEWCTSQTEKGELVKASQTLIMNCVVVGDAVVTYYSNEP